MKRLLDKAKMDKNKIKKIVIPTVATELGKISEPCYFPNMKAKHYQLMKATGLTSKVINEHIKEYYKGSRVKESWNVERDEVKHLMILILYYFLQENDIKNFNMMMVFYSIKMYDNIIHKYFPKFCNEEVFSWTGEHLVKNHLYSVHKTISNAIFYLGQEYTRKWKVRLKDPKPDELSIFIREARDRHNQSMKSFRRLYQRAVDEGLAHRAPGETEEGVEYEDKYKTAKIVNDMIKKLTVYKQIDKKAMMDAKTLTKINTSRATLLTASLGDTKFSDNVKIILELFLKDLKDVNNICGKGYTKYLQKLMSVKRTNSNIYFKQQVDVLLVKLLNEAKIRDEYEKQTSQTQYLNKLFLAYYISMVLKNTIC